MAITGFPKKSTRKKAPTQNARSKLKDWQPLIAASVGSGTAILTASIAFYAVQQTIASQTNMIREQIRAQSTLAYGVEDKKTTDQINHLRIALCTELNAIRSDAERLDSFAAKSYANNRTIAAVVTYKPRFQIYRSLIDKLYLLSPGEIASIYRAYEFQENATRSAHELFASADGETFTLNRNHMEFAQFTFFPLGQAAAYAVQIIRSQLPTEARNQCRI